MIGKVGRRIEGKNGRMKERKGREGNKHVPCPYCFLMELYHEVVLLF